MPISFMASGIVPTSAQLAGSLIDLWFAGGQYFGVSAPTDVLSIARASTGYAKTTTGTLTSFTSNQLRITDLGLLVENARTNIALTSEDFSAGSSWASGGVTVTADQSTAPNGTVTMDKVDDGTGNARHIVFQPGGGSTNVTSTFSVFVKDVDRRYIQLSFKGQSNPGLIYCYADLQTGTITDSGVGDPGTGTVFTSAKIEAFANGVYRVSLTGIYNSTENSFYLIAALSDRPTQGTGSFDLFNPQYVGSTKSVYLWGAQFEEASFWSSYIPTTTASVTRAADNITITGTAQSTIANAAASIVARTGTAAGSGFAANIVDSNGTNVLGFNSSNNALASITSTLTSGNTANRSLTVDDKLGLAWSGTGRSLALNGGTVVTDVVAQVPSSTQNLGSASATSNFIFSYVERLTLWNFKLADATLQGFTS